MSKLGERLLRSAKEARQIARGEAQPARAFTLSSIDVAAIRKRTDLSQDRFTQRSKDVEAPRPDVPSDRPSRR